MESLVITEHYVRYDYHYGRLGNRVMAFMMAVQLAKTNHRKLILDDPIIPLFFNMTPFDRYVAKRDDPLDERMVDRTYFRTGQDMEQARRFESFVLNSNVGTVDVGIAYDFTQVSVSPIIVRSLRLSDVFMEEASLFAKDHPSYDCFHHRGTDFKDTPNYISLAQASSIIQSHPNRSTSLFITSDEFITVLRLILSERLPEHAFYFTPKSMHPMLIEEEEWDVQNIGISLAICSQAKHAFLNPSSTFSHVIGMLASSTTKVVLLSRS